MSAEQARLRGCNWAALRLPAYKEGAGQVDQKLCAHFCFVRFSAEDGLGRLKNVVTSDLLTPKHPSKNLKSRVIKYWHILCSNLHTKSA